MNSRVFRRWNWELDRGVDPIELARESPNAYAIAFYDWRNRLFRVELHQTRQHHETAAPSEYAQIDVTVYDYYCDCNGRVLQKRSFDDSNGVFLIVDYEYDDEAQSIRETAWGSNSERSKSIVRKRQSSDALFEPVIGLSE